MMFLSDSEAFSCRTFDQVWEDYEHDLDGIPFNIMELPAAEMKGIEAEVEKRKQEMEEDGQGTNN